MIVGAILTQQTSWKNVEIAIEELKERHLLTPRALAGATADVIEGAIGNCGFCRQKARYIRGIVKYILNNYDGDADAMLTGNLDAKRAELLALDGVGEETADSIMLYGAGHPIFVVDAYTRRLCERLGLEAGKKYAEVQGYFMERLPRNDDIYRELHALIVEVSKRHCKKAPACDGCPLARMCARAKRKMGDSAKVNI
jgi:endonuclease-3 related protein